MTTTTIVVIMAATVLGGLSGAIGSPFGHYLVENLRKRAEGRRIKDEG